MIEAATWAVAIVSAYFIGALPSGIIVGKAWRGVDIRNYGSGSSGTTNVLRTLGGRAAAVTLVIDFLKGTAPVLAVRLVAGPLELSATDWLTAATGISAIVGHTWPVYVGFKGGKGIATGWGALAGMSPIGAGAGLVGVAVIAATRYVSLGALIGAGTALVITVVLAVGWGASYAHVVYTVVGCSLILVRHTENIDRLMKGTERRVEANARPERASGSERPADRS